MTADTNLILTSCLLERLKVVEKIERPTRKHKLCNRQKIKQQWQHVEIWTTFRPCSVKNVSDKGEGRGLDGMTDTTIPGMFQFGSNCKRGLVNSGKFNQVSLKFSPRIYELPHSQINAIKPDSLTVFTFTK